MFADNTIKNNGFDIYRTTVAGKPITEEERKYIIQPLLQDDIVKKMIGLNMMTDNTMSNDLFGYLMASGRI